MSDKPPPGAKLSDHIDEAEYHKLFGFDADGRATERAEAELSKLATEDMYPEAALLEAQGSSSGKVDKMGTPLKDACEVFADSSKDGAIARDAHIAEVARVRELMEGGDATALQPTPGWDREDATGSSSNSGEGGSEYQPDTEDDETEDDVEDDEESDDSLPRRGRPRTRSVTAAEKGKGKKQKPKKKPKKKKKKPKMEYRKKGAAKEPAKKKRVLRQSPAQLTGRTLDSMLKPGVGAVSIAGQYLTTVVSEPSPAATPSKKSSKKKKSGAGMARQMSAPPAMDHGRLAMLQLTPKFKLSPEAELARVRAIHAVMREDVALAEADEEKYGLCRVEPRTLQVAELNKRYPPRTARELLRMLDFPEHHCRLSPGDAINVYREDRALREAVLAHFGADVASDLFTNVVADADIDHLPYESAVKYDDVLIATRILSRKEVTPGGPEHELTKPSKSGKPDILSIMEEESTQSDSDGGVELAAESNARRPSPSRSTAGAADSRIELRTGAAPFYPRLPTIPASPLRVSAAAAVPDGFQARIARLSASDDPSRVHSARRSSSASRLSDPVLHTPSALPARSRKRRQISPIIVPPPSAPLRPLTHDDASLIGDMVDDQAARDGLHEHDARMAQAGVRHATELSVVVEDTTTNYCFPVGLVMANRACPISAQLLAEEGTAEDDADSAGGFTRLAPDRRTNAAVVRQRVARVHQGKWVAAAASRAFRGLDVPSFGQEIGIPESCLEAVMDRIAHVVLPVDVVPPQKKTRSGSSSGSSSSSSSSGLSAVTSRLAIEDTKEDWPPAADIDWDIQHGLEFREATYTLSYRVERKLHEALERRVLRALRSRGIAADALMEVDGWLGNKMVQPSTVSIITIRNAPIERRTFAADLRRFLMAFYLTPLHKFAADLGGREPPEPGRHDCWSKAVRYNEVDYFLENFLTKEDYKCEWGILPSRDDNTEHVVYLAVGERLAASPVFDHLLAWCGVPFFDHNGGPFIRGVRNYAEDGLPSCTIDVWTREELWQLSRDGPRTPIDYAVTFFAIPRQLRTRVKLSAALSRLGVPLGACWATTNAEKQTLVMECSEADLEDLLMVTAFRLSDDYADPPIEIGVATATQRRFLSRFKQQCEFGKCSNCGEPGHTRENCTMQGVCWSCGMRDHNRGECRMRREGIVECPRCGGPHGLGSEDCVVLVFDKADAATRPRTAISHACFSYHGSVALDRTRRRPPVEEARRPHPPGRSADHDRGDAARRGGRRQDVRSQGAHRGGRSGPYSGPPPRAARSSRSRSRSRDFR